jgi:hypothetical protein
MMVIDGVVNNYSGKTALSPVSMHSLEFRPYIIHLVKYWFLMLACKSIHCVVAIGHLKTLVYRS